MSTFRKIKWVVYLTLALMLVLSACGGGTKPGDEAGQKPTGDSLSKEASSKVNTEPFTLTIMITGADIDKELQDSRYKLPSFMAKYPNVKIEYQQISQLDQAVSSGQLPDLVNMVPAMLYDVKAAGLTHDLTVLIKKNQVDLSGFPASMISMIRNVSGADGMIALPGQPPDFKYWAAQALAYNKDIFDKFAVAYPKDNMTWDEVIELSKRFNRTDGGVEYHGLTLINPWVGLQAQKNLPFLNKAGQVDLSNAGWSVILQVMKNVNETQNDWINAVFGNPDVFTKNKDTAMSVGVVNSFVQGAVNLEKSGINWDMVTYPRFADQNVNVPYTSGFLVPTAKSKYPDAVMDLIKAMYATGGSNSNFENPVALKKHLDAIRGHDVALLEPTQFDTQLRKVFSDQVKEMLTSGKDINTTLRDLKEAFEQKVSEAK